MKNKMKSVEEILKERSKTHGEFSNHAKIACKLKETIKGSPALQTNYDALKPEHKEALDMIAHKIARILNGDPNEVDHWKDISGYSELGAKAC